ncbi:ABC transporter substrate-binding protein [Variovorax sp. J22R24]|uniref:ABC transporter substrate-binding protein n=1 Tax=Variovorax gracilis TaxID=3053502 RepID=UPI0025761AE8|nr:ABC transporter substrate-binding protein [Variovorax sp. J22R24]MDM0107646.1 ABC transporter substrate-binding protein [Variovorax sp. J22R24]
MHRRVTRKADIMNRRDISVGLFALVVLPQVMRAQEPGRIYRIGWLDVGPPEPTQAPYSPEWVQGMAKLGWILDTNLVVVYRHTDRTERLPALAAELVRLNVDVIVTYAAPQTEAAKQATGTIPIVFMVHGDPLGRGLIASLARPGGNITGSSQMLPELCVKRVQLLRELLPGALRIAVLWNVANPAKLRDWEATQQAARDLAFKLEPCHFTGPDDVQAACQMALKARADALMTLEDPLTWLFRSTIVDFAASARLPAIYSGEYAQIGGLMCYSINGHELHRLNVYYLDKIFRGAKPADLPVAQPMVFTLAVNLKTAKALDLTIPKHILTRAEVIIS